MSEKLQAWRVVNPDFTSSRGFRWPFPGSEEASTVVLPEPARGFSRGDPCPKFDGDGVCLAKTFRGAASGGMPAVTGLEVEFSPADVLGEDDDKLRVSKCRVIDVFDVQAVIRAGFCPNLGGANLWYANLRDANLRGAYLAGAYLTRTDFTDANLTDANLRDANLGGASLRGASLRGANLRGATLWGADLGDANLGDADLRDANLGGANLRGANLRGADLGGANLRGADLGDASANRLTVWPDGFDPATKGVIVR